MMTPRDCSLFLEHYQAMVIAARANDWDKLIELEQAVSALREDCMRREIEPSSIPEDLRQQMTDTLKEIQALDAEIRQHTEPAFESTRKLLASTVRDRTVRNTYSALSP